MNRGAAALALMSSSRSPSREAARERVVVDTQRLSENGALFIADANGYFKSEGMEIEMTALWKSPRGGRGGRRPAAPISGSPDLRAAAFNAAARVSSDAVAAVERKKRDYEGDRTGCFKYWASPRGCAGWRISLAKRWPSRHLGTAAHYKLGELASHQALSISPG